jgi:hypothetical protein
VIQASHTFCIWFLWSLYRYRRSPERDLSHCQPTREFANRDVLA